RGTPLTSSMRLLLCSFLALLLICGLTEAKKWKGYHSHSHSHERGRGGWGRPAPRPVYHNHGGFGGHSHGGFGGFFG
ncbi:hypothetical protein PMAYCL1PPCAC_17328, partial [Pristionchus mayeri]